MTGNATNFGTAGDQPGMLRWYVVQTQTYRESLAAQHLRSQDYTVFLPLRKRTRRHARKLDSVLVPFFPKYLFVQLNLSHHQWRSINGTRGVTRVISFGERPEPVPPGIIEALQLNCDAGGVFEGEELKVGQSVRILAGPFADLIGELDRLGPAGRVRILLDIMGRRMPITVGRDSVTSTG